MEYIEQVIPAAAKYVLPVEDNVSPEDQIRLYVYRLQYPSNASVNEFSAPPTTLRLNSNGRKIVCLELGYYDIELDGKGGVIGDESLDLEVMFEKVNDGYYGYVHGNGGMPLCTLDFALCALMGMGSTSSGSKGGGAPPPPLKIPLSMSSSIPMTYFALTKSMWGSEEDDMACKYVTAFAGTKGTCLNSMSKTMWLDRFRTVFFPDTTKKECEYGSYSSVYGEAAMCVSKIKNPDYDAIRRIARIGAIAATRDVYGLFTELKHESFNIVKSVALVHAASSVCATKEELNEIVRSSLEGIAVSAELMQAMDDEAEKEKEEEEAAKAKEDGTVVVATTEDDKGEATTVAVAATTEEGAATVVAAATTEEKKKRWHD